MYILKFMAQRTKNLTAIRIDSDGKNVILSGANGQGKSNILNIIMSMLTGERLADPIKHGEDKAEAFLDLGDFKIRKRWTAKGEYIQVMTAAGDIKSKPMEFLGGIVGRISFDPMDFMKMKPKEQRESLRKLVGLDFIDIQKQYDETFSGRSELSSQIKGLIAQLQNTEPPNPNTPDEEITFKEELEKINALKDKKKLFDEVIKNKDEIENSIHNFNVAISQWEEDIKELTHKIEEARIAIDGYNISLENIIVPPQVTESEIIAVESSLTDIEDKNVTIRAAKRYRELVRQSNKLKTQYDEYTQKLNRLEQDKATRIANAKFPIEGMSMDDEEIMYQGKKMSILSTGQQMRVCTGMSMALNPTLKLIFIRHGNDLDSAGRKEIFDMAEKDGYNIWMEVVDESGDLGYFIEDGSITKIDGKDVPQPVIEEEKKEEKPKKVGQVVDTRVNGDGEGMEV